MVKKFKVAIVMIGLLIGLFPLLALAVTETPMPPPSKDAPVIWGEISADQHGYLRLRKIKPVLSARHPRWAFVGKTLVTGVQLGFSVLSYFARRGH